MCPLYLDWYVTGQWAIAVSDGFPEPRNLPAGSCYSFFLWRIDPARQRPCGGKSTSVSQWPLQRAQRDGGVHEFTQKTLSRKSQRQTPLTMQIPLKHLGTGTLEIERTGIQKKTLITSRGRQTHLRFQDWGEWNVCISFISLSHSPEGKLSGRRYISPKVEKLFVH